MSRSLVPHGGNDVVFTPEYLAKNIINNFNPTGSILDPCKGDGVFLDNFPKHPDNDWCEILLGRDFLTYDFDKKFDWVITNPPWSKIRPFLQKSMILSDNIVFLCLVNAFFMKARLRDMKEHNFNIKEIMFLDTPNKPWPQTGFQLGAVHIQKNYTGNIKVTNEH